MVDCYIALGGNLSQTLPTMRQALKLLKQEERIEEFRVSHLYQTKPVSSIKQNDFYNAVCRFQTSLSLEDLWNLILRLETALGKRRKMKNAPRLIDLDLLFFGPLIAFTQKWILPHPRWHERLFVLAPLADVTEEVPIAGLKVKEMLACFSNPHREKVRMVEGLDAES